MAIGDNIDIAGSDQARDRMLKRYGFVPFSVIRQIHYGYLSKRMLQFQGWRPATRNASTDFSKQKTAALAAQGKKVAAIPPFGVDRPALSIMPAELVDFFIKFYAEPGQTYLDPFMAQGIQMQVARMHGLHYWGMDLNEEFFRFCDEIRPSVEAMPAGAEHKPTITIKHGDSRAPDHVPDGIGDFSFHSPPYWDIENYGDDPRQLGTGKSYADFLDGMCAVAKAWLPKFKPSAYHVVNVGDFVRGERFYCYHADTIRIFEGAGWRLHDLWVLDQLVAGSNRIFAVSTCNKKRAPRVHEYALVFRPAGASK